LRRRRGKIKLLSILFALAGAAIFAVLTKFILDAKKATSKESFAIQKINSFSEMKFKTYDKNGKEINVASESVYETKKDEYVLKNSVSSFALSNGEFLTISADVAKAVKKDKTECEFTGNVKLSTESGFLMKTEKLFVYFNKKIATGDVDVAISQDDTKLSSKKYFFDMNDYVLTLTGDAKGFLRTSKISSDKLIIRFDGSGGKKVKSIDALKNVVLLYKKDGDDYDVRSDSMLAQINNGALDNIKANGSLIIKTKDAIIRANRGILKGDKIDVFGNVSISGKQGNIFGNSAMLDVKTGDIFIDKSSGILDDGKRN
jgi:LPS export ABC transporter protein LptC